MNKFQELSDQIECLIHTRDFLKAKYEASEFHKRKEKYPQTAVPPGPHDGEIYKLLTAIQQLEKYIKELQDEQFHALKEET
jgi:hypothetical protein